MKDRVWHHLTGLIAFHLEVLVQFWLCRWISQSSYNSMTSSSLFFTTNYIYFYVCEPRKSPSFSPGLHVDDEESIDREKKWQGSDSKIAKSHACGSYSAVLKWLWCIHIWIVILCGHIARNTDSFCSLVSLRLIKII